MRGTVVKLALFTAVCVAMTTYLAFTIGNVQRDDLPFFRNSYRLTASFDDVSGLLPNDNVKVAGVVVGKVKSVRVERGRAVVSFTVRDTVRLPTDSRAAVRWRNLLGQRYVYLYPGEAATVLRGDDRIRRTASVVDLGELFNRLGPIVKAVEPSQVNAFLEAVVTGLTGNEQHLRQAIDDLALVMGTLGERDQAIGRLVENLATLTGTVADRDREIRVVLENLVAVARTFSENTSVLDAAVTELGGFSEHLAALLQGNRVEIDRIVANLAAVVEVVDAKLPTLDSALANLDDAALRLFTASRHGEWLNQVIPCGVIGYPDGLRANCNPSTSGATAAASAGRRGSEALLGMVDRVVGGAAAPGS